MVVELTVNGVGRVAGPGTTVADLVAEVTAVARGGAVRSGGTGSAPLGRGVAVAVNGQIVPRADWATTGLGEGDRVEVLTAAQGG